MFVDKPLPSERPTGIGVASYGMALALSQRRRRVYFVCRGNDERSQSPNEYLTIRKVKRFTRSNAFVALEVLGKGEFPLFHIHSNTSSLLSLLLGRAFGRRVISHTHGVEPLSIGRTIRYSIAMNAANSVIATAESVKDEIVRGYHIPPKKITVIRNGVDCEEFRPQRRTPGIMGKYGLLEFDQLLLSVQSVSKEKGQWRVIECLPEVLKRWPRLVYVNAGAIDDLLYWRQLIERSIELGVAKSVRFLGTVPRSDLVDLITSADLCVHPSTRIGSASDMAVMEEMACGKAVIACCRNQKPNTIDPEVNGLLLDSAKVERLRSAILEILEAPEWASALGRAAREKAVSRFTWNSTAESLEAVYKLLLS